MAKKLKEEEKLEKAIAESAKKMEKAKAEAAKKLSEIEAKLPKVVVGHSVKHGKTEPIKVNQISAYNLALQRANDKNATEEARQTATKDAEKLKQAADRDTEKLQKAKAELDDKLKKAQEKENVKLNKARAELEKAKVEASKKAAKAESNKNGNAAGVKDANSDKAEAPKREKTEEQKAKDTDKLKRAMDVIGKKLGYENGLDAYNHGALAEWKKEAPGEGLSYDNFLNSANRNNLVGLKKDTNEVFKPRFPRQDDIADWHEEHIPMSSIQDMFVPTEKQNVPALKAKPSGITKFWNSVWTTLGGKELDSVRDYNSSVRDRNDVLRSNDNYDEMMKFKEARDRKTENLSGKEMQQKDARQKVGLEGVKPQDVKNVEYNKALKTENIQNVKSASSEVKSDSSKRYKGM